MSVVKVIPEGGTIPKKATEAFVVLLDWDRVLAAGVSITSSTFTLTRDSGPSDTALTYDEPSTPDGNRNAQLRVAGGTAGAVWRVRNVIQTSETPQQTLDGHFLVSVE